MKQMVREAKRPPAAHCYDSIITICGAGTLGGNLAETLARRGFQRLRLIDRDWVEEQNLATQPFEARDIGTPKARTLTRVLYDVAEAEAEPFVVELTEDNATTLLAGSQLIVDAFDNTAGRQAVAQACASLELPCIHLTTDARGRCGLLGWSEDEPEIAGDMPEDFSPPATLANQIVDAACESILRFLLTGEKCAGKVSLDAVAV